MACKSGGGSALAQVFDDLVRTETRLYNHLNDRLRQAHGIVTSQFELLRHLRAHPGTRVADIAETFAIGIGATSKSLDRLERSGWVRRTPNPADRRSSLIELTTEGARLAGEADVTFTRELAALLGDASSPDDLVAAGAFLARLRASLEAGRVGVPTG
ncbi:MarR family transcriptional regulator [Microlunatus spumicola]|uniref:MarR family transcriptional regulator n=1 Tax=Microlunatus spumicola TaxID=81499 RepID=UPI001957A41C